MKKYLFLFVTVVLLALFSGRAHAQRYLPGMKGAELRGGFANGSESPLNYYTGLAVPGYTPKANRRVIDIEYLMKNYGYRNASAPRTQLMAESGYYLKFLLDSIKTVFLPVDGSALAGYETVNWGDRMLFNGPTLLAKDAFVYGGAITLEFEAYLTDRIVLLAGIRERVLRGSSLNLLTTQFGLSVKFIIRQNRTAYDYRRGKRHSYRRLSDTDGT